MSRFVEEDGLERSEKVEGVRGMLEGVVEGVGLLVVRTSRHLLTLLSIGRAARS
jgi:hypothetical protein